MTNILVIIGDQMLIFDDLGVTIRDGRKEKGWNQSKLADYANLTRATISSLESGNFGDIGIRKVERVLNLVGKKLTISDKGFPNFEQLQKMDWDN